MTCQVNQINPLLLKKKVLAVIKTILQGPVFFVF